ncbi:hypothetical protein J5N97_003431 [Dioscorea zingiberensis]|uniref:Flowering-promoting factor 1-like protein 3 n=1 Tax=Dioscorea zingiberensis TaxID=325984 RepID=A0A9D5D6M9_9LILI|nr:hypothetical protein J5N97_003431 [Dioscorea zingiberensis]
MSGVWVFRNGVVRLRENPAGNALGYRRKALAYIPTNEVIVSHEMLENKLAELGWERYHSDSTVLLQFHKNNSVHLISVPRDFTRLTSVHMYDIVVKTRNVFEVRDVR